MVEVVNENGNWMLYKDGMKYPYSLRNVISVWND